MEGLTLEILDEAIEKIRQYELDHEVIGFKLNPSDLRDIKTGTQLLFCAGNNRLTITPPYRGLILIADVDVPPGYPKPIRKSDKDSLG